MGTIAATSEGELADAVRAAREDGRTLEIVGAGTKRNYGRPLETSDVLDLSGLSGIVSYEPEELVITARAGTPIAEIEAALAGKRQRLGFDPADWGPLFGAPANTGTIAGALAADVSGSARIRYGAARDHLIGFRAVNGFGEAYKGGSGVEKNVTGFDLPKLMCGAMGTLGVLSEVTLRLVPRAPRAVTFAVKDIVPEQGLTLLRRIWAMPLEPTGLAYVPACISDGFAGLGDIGPGAALIRIDGAQGALTEKRAALRTLLEGEDAIEGEAGDALFAEIGAGSAFAATATDVWRIAVPPSESVITAHALAGTQWVADWAGGLFWAGLSQTDAVAAARLRHIAARSNGSATLLRASAATRATIPVFPPDPQARAALTRSVKAAFDPLCLLNPGRMFKGV